MKFTSNEYNIKVGKAGEMGNGIFAKRIFLPGQEVATYPGRLFKGGSLSPELIQFLKDNPDLGHYAIEHGDNETLVPTREQLKKPGAYLANHSCNPNCQFQGKNHSLYAKRKILLGEEITVYYGWSGISNTPCLCGDKLCTGIIGLKQTVEFDQEEDENGIRHGKSCQLDRDCLKKSILTSIANHWEKDLGRLLLRRIEQYWDTLPVILGQFAEIAFGMKQVGITFDITPFNMMDAKAFDAFFAKAEEEYLKCETVENEVSP